MSRSHPTPQPAPLSRYSRQLVLPQIGPDGQEKLGAANVLVVGVGALGSSMAEMLARAGIGTLRLLDRDYLEIHNLQRQSLYTEADVDEGLPKAIAAANHLRAVNSQIAIEPIVADLTAENIEEVLGHDAACPAIVLDGTDNIHTRYLLNDACVKHGIPWVYSGVIGVCSVSLTIQPGESACLRCLYPAAPPSGAVDTCDVAGVLGPAAHVAASVAAAEAVKLIVGDPPAKGLLVADLWSSSFERIEVPRNPDCPACVHHVFDYLDAEEARLVSVRLCGRDSVQVRVPGGVLDLPWLGERLKAAGVGEVQANEYLVRLRTASHELTAFADGRVIVKGTEDIAAARGLVAKYIGT